MSPASLRLTSGRFPSVRALVIAPAIALIRAYQLVVSPMRPATCRFYPSCSAYALTAIERFGLVRGSWLATRRLLRCHPWNPGGVDHVPGTTSTTEDLMNADD
ncbi:MAG: membrane protein insertion efficiency factor YidD [Actinomycetota bacterium]